MLDIGELEYIYRSGINDMIRKKELSEDSEYRHNGIFVGTTLITTDNKCIIVNLSGKSNNHNTQDLVGGLLEGPYNSSSNILYDVMYQEIEEETNINLQYIISCVLQMIYVANNGNIGAYFETKINLNSNEVVQLFKKNNDIDIKSLSFLSIDEYKSFLASSAPSKQLIYSEFFQ